MHEFNSNFLNIAKIILKFYADEMLFCRQFDKGIFHKIEMDTRFFVFNILYITWDEEAADAIKIIASTRSRSSDNVTLEWQCSESKKLSFNHIT